MNKEEFSARLQHALSSGMTGSQVSEHVRYYREYIDSEIHKGRTEEEVLTSLGDPRLLARSIIDANKRSGTAYGSNRTYDEEAGGEDVYEKKNHVKRVMLPGWLVALIVVVIALLVIGVVSSLLYLFAPVIMAVLIVLLVVKVIQGNRR